MIDEDERVRWTTKEILQVVGGISFLIGMILLMFLAVGIDQKRTSHHSELVKAVEKYCLPLGREDEQEHHE